MKFKHPHLLILTLTPFSLSSPIPIPTPPLRPHLLGLGSALGDVAAGIVGVFLKPSSAQVTGAVDSFANDANTVSSCLNMLPSTSSSSQIRSLATTAYDHEMDEDQHRIILMSAAGSNGEGIRANGLIVQYTPTVLDGLMKIMNDPNSQTVGRQVSRTSGSRNPNFLPSITSLSNTALSAMGMQATAQRFPATNQG